MESRHNAALARLSSCAPEQGGDTGRHWAAGAARLRPRSTTAASQPAGLSLPFVPSRAFHPPLPGGNQSAPAPSEGPAGPCSGLRGGGRAAAASGDAGAGQLRFAAWLRQGSQAKALGAAAAPAKQAPQALANARQATSAPGRPPQHPAAICSSCGQQTSGARTRLQLQLVKKLCEAVGVGGGNRQVPAIQFSREPGGVM